MEPLPLTRRRPGGTLIMTLRSSSSSGIMSAENCSHCCRMEEAMAGEKELEESSRSSHSRSANCSGVTNVSARAGVGGCVRRGCG